MPAHKFMYRWEEKDDTISPQPQPEKEVVEEETVVQTPTQTYTYTSYERLEKLENLFLTADFETKLEIYNEMKEITEENNLSYGLERFAHHIQKIYELL